MSIQRTDNVLERGEITDDLLQLRRLQLLRILDQRVVQTHQVEILHNLQQNKTAAFLINDTAAAVIRAGLQDKRRRRYESTASGYLSVVAYTTDDSGVVYQLDEFIFENIGAAD